MKQLKNDTRRLPVNRLAKKRIFWQNLSLSGPFLDQNILFDSSQHMNLLDIIAFYHNMQYQKKIMGKSRENEFGDKKNLETSPKMALFWAKYFFD